MKLHGELIMMNLSLFFESLHNSLYIMCWVSLLVNCVCVLSLLLSSFRPIVISWPRRQRKLLLGKKLKTMNPVLQWVDGDYGQTAWWMQYALTTRGEQHALLKMCWHVHFNKSIDLINLYFHVIANLMLNENFQIHYLVSLFSSNWSRMRYSDRLWQKI